MGAPLFFRHGWGVSLTPEGEVLEAHAREMLGRVQDAKSAIGALAAAPSGKIVVGVLSSLAEVLLPDWAMEARRELPNLQVRMIEGYSGDLHQRMLAGEIDLAVVYRERHLPVVMTRPLLREPLVAAGAPGVFEQNQEISINDLLKRELLVTATAGHLRRLVEDAAAKTATARSTILEIDSFPAQFDLLERGAGVAVLPYSTVARRVEEGRLSCATFAPKPLNRFLMLVRPAARYETPAWKAMANILFKQVRLKREVLRWRLAPDLED